MANVGKILAPRRASKTTMSTTPGSAIVLAAGEIFIEDDTSAGVFRIKIGDGSTAYASLGYAFSGASADIKFVPGESGLTSTNVQNALVELAAMAGSGSGVCYGTCSTAAATAAKAVTVSSDQDFELKVGATVLVKFTNTNSAANATLNVNSTGAKPIYYNNAAYTAAGDIAGFASGYISYTYDGTYWVYAGASRDLDTTYAAITSTEITTGTDTDLKTVRADYLKTGVNDLIDAKAWTGTSQQYGQIQNPDPTVNYYIDDNVTPSNNSEQR